MMSQAMIRGVMDESGEQFVAYFLPTADTMEKRSKDFEEGRDYDDEQASVLLTPGHQFSPFQPVSLTFFIV